MGVLIWASACKVLLLIYLPLRQFTDHLIIGVLIQYVPFLFCWTPNYLDKLSVFNLSRLASIEEKPTGDAGCVYIGLSTGKEEPTTQNVSMEVPPSYCFFPFFCLVV